MSDDVLRYFLVTHRRTGQRFKMIETSRTKAKKRCPRHEEAVGYKVLYTVKELTRKEYYTLGDTEKSPF